MEKKWDTLVSTNVQMILCAMLLCSIAHSIIRTRLFRWKMHSDWFSGIKVLQGRWQHGEKVGYCYQYKCTNVQMILCAMLLCSIAHSIICTRLFHWKMHSDWFSGIKVLQGRWQHGEKVGYCCQYKCTNDTVCNAAMQHCTQYHLYTAVSLENAF